MTIKFELEHEMSNGNLWRCDVVAHLDIRDCVGGSDEHGQHETFRELSDWSAEYNNIRLIDNEGDYLSFDNDDIPYDIFNSITRNEVDSSF